MSAASSCDENLTAAFSMILDRPVPDDPGAYAAWYCCHDLSYELFESGFDPAPLAEGEIVRAPFPTIPDLGALFEGWDLFAPHWTIDLGRSRFFADDEELVPGLEAGLSGRQLGRELRTRGIDPEELTEAYPTVVFRVHTDGSLFDAMRTLTGTHRGAEHLLPLTPAHGVHESWNRRFAELPDPALADHLRNLFRTEHSARSDGAYHLGTKSPAPDAFPEVITAWQFGEAQAWSAVTPVVAAETADPA